MPISTTVQAILDRIDTQTPRMGDVKKIAAEIKKDHSLAHDLWATGRYGPRLVAIMIMDKGRLTQDAIETFTEDMATHTPDQRDKLSELLLANQLMKSKKTIALLDSWQDHPSPILRRLFWYHQGRLRWMGKVPVDNAPQLLAAIDTSMQGEDPQVQWAMNFAAGWIGVYEPAHRPTCIAIGKKLGLYKGDPVSRGCTPNYLPEFIAMEVEKRT